MNYNKILLELFFLTVNGCDFFCQIELKIILIIQLLVLISPIFSFCCLRTRLSSFPKFRTFLRKRHSYSLQSAARASHRPTRTESRKTTRSRKSTSHTCEYAKKPPAKPCAHSTLRPTAKGTRPNVQRVVRIVLKKLSTRDIWRMKNALGYFRPVSAVEFIMIILIFDLFVILTVADGDFSESFATLFWQPITAEVADIGDSLTALFSEPLTADMVDFNESLVALSKEPISIVILDAILDSISLQPSNDIHESPDLAELTLNFQEKLFLAGSPVASNSAHDMVMKQLYAPREWYYQLKV